MDILSWGIAALFVIILWVGAVMGMRRGWRKRAASQRDDYGELYPVPTDKGAILLGSIRGIYAGSVIPDRSAERFVLGSSGFRSSAELTGYSQGILCQRPDLEDIWIPRSAIVDMRMGKFFAGKVPPGGVLIISHILCGQDSRKVIETGFRVNPQTQFAGYAQWIEIYRPEISLSVPERN